MHVHRLMTFSSEVLIHLESSAGLLQREVGLIDHVSYVLLRKEGQNDLVRPIQPLQSN